METKRAVRSLTLCYLPNEKHIPFGSVFSLSKIYNILSQEKDKKMKVTMILYLI